MRLELSSEGRYAIRALVYLARHPNRVSAETIAAEAGIPRRLLARIFVDLARAGLVASKAGRDGKQPESKPQVTSAQDFELQARRAAQEIKNQAKETEGRSRCPSAAV